jgi:2'-hydroxyisoflavone reductase
MVSEKKILVLGGSTFIGPALVESAIKRGHEVTLFNRGVSQPESPPQSAIEALSKAENVIGDRQENLDRLGDRSWDMVIDTSGYEPESVEIAARFFSERTSRYMFVSSISVYEKFDRPGLTESTKLRELPEDGPADYGSLKAACEKIVQLTLGQRALVVRPGLIVGPLDPTDRFTYWIHRVAEGGPIVAPGRPDAPVQFIDVRDLAQWMVQLTEQESSGVYHVTGPDYVLTMQDFLEECRRLLNKEAEFVWVNEENLVELGAKAWTQLPLWIPDSEEEARFMRSIDCSKALSDGLEIRPLRDTISDTASWHSTRTLDGGELKAGLTPDFEQMILAAKS